MRRHAVVLILGIGALLLTPGAAGVPDVPGDPTPPVVTPVITGTLGAAGWYTTNVTVNWTVVDPESIILSTTGCNAVTFTANTTGTPLTCTAESDGGTASVSKTFKVDKTAPAATAAPSRTADSNGWYNHELSVDFIGDDTTSGLESCSPDAAYAGPDTVGTTVSGTCRDRAGNTAPAALVVKYDQTAPQASPAARPPDANGWHNHAVTVTFQGNDGTSGVESCTQTTYGGPDDPSVPLSGTCRDRAGNVSPAAPFTLSYDETPPQATATPSRTADVNGWHNHALTVSFSGSDVTSGLDSCDPPKSYAGPDALNASVSGACRDRAGNSAPRSFALKYDSTAPQATATPARAANANGWYAAPISVSFAGSDATAGVDSCSAAKSYSGPDSSAAQISGACADVAGNVGAATLPLKYDATAPQVTATPARPAGQNGWYSAPLSVSFGATDATSGIETCDAAKTYSGPDAAAATVTGSCRDRAGNSAAGSLPLKYDATAPSVTAAPSRAANANGWYNAALAVSFTAGDATSGVDTCDAAKTYSGPDSAATSVAGNCRDRAGNSGTGSYALKYDATPPQTAATPSRPADANGWFNHALTVNFSATDPTAGIDSCDPAKSYAGPDSGSATVAGACRDRAGNTGSATLPLKYDQTAPQATATPARPADVNGWYNRALLVTFAATDATAGLDSCPVPRNYTGPDSAAATVSGACLDRAGNSAVASLPLKYDATGPQATATPARPANAAGWYASPLSVTFAGTDATSGLESCPAPLTYAGPDSPTALVSGTCLDKAGNGTPASLALKYDATAPQATATASRPADFGGWFNHALTITFAATDATSGLESCPTPRNYTGPDNAAAAVSGTCLDRAGNSAAASLSLKYDATAPLTTATPARAANANGWYSSPLAVSFAGTDATAGVGSCEPQKTYSAPDSAVGAVVGTCQDRAGNVGATSFGLKYDATAPQVAATPARVPDSNGWYNHQLSVGFAGTDATSGLDSCDAPKSYSGPDNAGATVTGSCRDLAGNSGVRLFVLGYDATAPQMTGTTPARIPDRNGWYNHPVALAFQGMDATSGIALGACTQATYGGPDNGAASVVGSCRDRAGNLSGTTSFGLKYDGTAPVASASAERSEDANGWYNHPLTVSFAGTDATSGLDSCPGPSLYSGPDSAAAAVSGTCLDKAGNATGASLPFKYDATAPQASTAASRQPNPNGWYNAPLTVSFSASDPLSGLASCPGPLNYAGPDSASAVVTGTCLDRAGNGALASLPLKYDGTAPTATGVPSRPADANGWFNHPLTVAFQGSDPISGIESCTAPKSYAGPDTAAVLLSGTCRDLAGNESGSGAFSVKYDATAPQVASAVPSRGPDQAGWYNRPIGFAVEGSDVTSGLASCPTVTYRGPDGAEASVDATCIDVAGNRASRPFALRYDATGPATTASPDRAPDANGWYNRALTVTFAGVDTVSGTDSCTGAQSYDGPDSVEVIVGGVCRDRAGNVGLASLPVSYDATAPQVVGANPSRPPDSNGWYNRPLLVSFHGSDVTSQIDSCTAISYAGPDAAASSVTGSCRDRAGNGSAARSFALRFDGTAPSLTGVRAKSGNARVELSWTASPDTSLVEVRRSGKLVYSGTGRSFTDTRVRNGVRYRYTLTGYDEAANQATSAVTARPTGPLVSPPAGATVSAPPQLAWAAVPNATYYNVQLFRRGKILSAWPRGTSLRLRRTWVYAGRRYRLSPGRYRWYVWPGLGRRSEKRFGRQLGSSSFVVR